MHTHKISKMKIKPYISMVSSEKLIKPYVSMVSNERLS